MNNYRAPVEHASMYILPNFIHARLSALIGRISMSSKTPGPEYGAYGRCLYFVWVLWLHLAKVRKTSHSSFPFTGYSTTHPGASSKVWIDISNLNLPRIIDTVAKCELQTANNVRKTAKLYGAHVNSLPRICVT